MPFLVAKSTVIVRPLGAGFDVASTSDTVKVRGEFPLFPSDCASPVMTNTTCVPGHTIRVELSARPGRPGERAYDAMLLGCEKGVMLRITADTIAMSPPLIVSEEQIDEIVGLLGEVLDELE